jgi:hypothetical protein
MMKAGASSLRVFDLSVDIGINSRNPPERDPRKQDRMLSRF